MENEKLENKIESLEAEIALIKRSIGIREGKKSFSAWKKIEKISKKKWKSRKPSWEIISKSRK